MKVKVISTLRIPRQRTLRIGELEQKTLALYDKIQTIKADGGHLVFADEAIFTSKGYQTRAWAGPGRNVVVEDRGSSEPCKAVVAAVCACHGLLTFYVQDHSIKGPDFAAFLKDVRGACGEERVHLFIDNCNVHREKEHVWPLWEQLDIEPVWNVSYSPWYNAAVER